MRQLRAGSVYDALPTLPSGLLRRLQTVYDPGMATYPEPHLITAEQFLQIDFGSDIRAELDNGIVRMMAGGTAAHARIQSNLMLAIGLALRGSGCRAYGPDMGLRTHDKSVRYPDISVYCGKDSAAFDDAKAFDDPVIIVEVLSPSTSSLDQGIKLQEYRWLPSVQTILLIDPDAETVRSVTRTGAHNWTDNLHGPGEDIIIPGLCITVAHAEIFAR